MRRSLNRAVILVGALAAGLVVVISVHPAVVGDALAGRVGNTHEALYWEHLGHRAMRRNDWKIVYVPANNRWELYDLGADPTELDDLAMARPEILGPMIEAWGAWARRVGARADGP